MATGNPSNKPTKKEINQANADLKTQVDLLQSVYDQSYKIQETLKEQLNIVKEINKEGQNQFSLQDKLNEALKKQEETKKKIDNLSGDFSKTAKGAALEKKITEGFKAKAALSARLTELRAKELKLAEANKRINEGDKSAIADQAKLISEISSKKRSIATEERKISELAKIIAADQDDLVKKYGDQEAALAAQLIVALQQKEIDTNLVQNLKAKLKFAQANNDADKDRIEYLKEQLKLTDKQKESLRKIKETLGINKLLAAFSLTTLIKGLLDLDQATTDFARNLGVSGAAARKLTDSFKDAQYNAKNLNSNLNTALFNIRSQVEATNALNESFGTANVFTDKQVADQVFLTKQIGLQAGEAAGLLKLGLLNGKSAEKVTNEIADQVVNLRRETGVMLNFKKILAEVAKVSGQLAAQYKNNPKLLAQAVIQAQRLGLTLADTAKMADSLLDFEKSIENELKAELLVGKQLNFEKARALALDGKSAEAAAELIKQTGGLNEFQKLNVIQQRALAESVGLTANEMADALKQQKMLQETGFGTFEQLKNQADSIKDQTARQQFLNEIKKTATGEQLVKQYEQVSLQEKFNALIVTLQENILKLAEGPIGSLLRGLTDILSTAGGIKTLFGIIGGIMAFNIVYNITKGIQSMRAFSKAVKAAAAAEKSLATASAFSAGLVSPLAVGLGIAAAIAAVAAINSALPDVDDGGGGGGVSVSAPSGGGGIDTAAAATSARVSSNAQQLELLNRINNNIEKQNTKPIQTNVKVDIAGKTARELSTTQAQETTKTLA